MQYVRNLSGSVSTAWNSINPATLSGAIDVIVVEQEDGTLACSPFHVRFGKFSLLRPYDKKVEFKVNGVKQDYSMKLGEGGEAFFVFETTDTIPQSLQTSPLASPVTSPEFRAQSSSGSSLGEPDVFELNGESAKPVRPPPVVLHQLANHDGLLTPRSTSPELSKARPSSRDSQPQRPHSDDVLRHTARKLGEPSLDGREGSVEADSLGYSDRSHSPPPLPPQDAYRRALALAKELSAVNIPTHITESGDLMLDMTGYKDNDEDALRAELFARKVLSEELEGNYDIGSLFGVDDQGNLWIYSSHEAKEAAMKQAMKSTMRLASSEAADAASDPGYHSDGSDTTASPMVPSHRRSESDAGQQSLQTPPASPPTMAKTAGDPNRNYAKTLRLTSEQLKALNLKHGENSMSFTVNKATCTAYMWLWKAENPVVISDIDGTITKSDALGHVLNMIGRDWTHAGVAKLYCDIVSNGYNIMYLTSRSVGQSDTTRAYLAGVQQDGYRLPRGPTILSPDRTMAALRREVYLRKPHIFKMSTLRDIRSLYGPDRKPFYAGFGNRFTDQISYRTVDVPRHRIFTINSNAEVSLDLLSFNTKLTYVNMSEVVDHYFPPVSTLVKGGGEEYTDFTYWRDTPLELDDFSASDSEDDGDTKADDDAQSEYADDDDEEVGDGLTESYISNASVEEDGDGDESLVSSTYDGDRIRKSIEDFDDAEYEGGEDYDEEEEDEGEEEDEQITPNLTVPDLKHEDDSTRKAVKDVNAELITGVSNLAMEK